ncbi:hypothetical protein H0H81_007232 [Sphagnurus paluster]|uniref:Uncharacterized protein n=1 Tax=Sphagnurus paluster TaxID=117069 RepID=A0A9P7FWQ6_9AGAR|nr:hypothetical protein H0H81_007232 [Sphagnurus paluster]
MPAGGSPQPMSVDPGGSTPTRTREAVPQRPQSTLSTISRGSTDQNPEINTASRQWISTEVALLLLKRFAPHTVTEAIARSTQTEHLQGLYESLKFVTASIVEVARTRDIILAPSQAAPTPPTPELSQLPQKPLLPPNMPPSPPPAPTFLSAARAAADKPQPLPPPPKPAAKRRQPTKVVGLPEEGLCKTVPGFEHGILHIAPWVKITKIKIPDVPVWNYTIGAPYSIQDVTAVLDHSTVFSDIRVTNKAAWAKAPATFRPTTLSAVSFSIEDPDGAVSNRLRHTALYLLGKKCRFEKWKPKPTSTNT